MAKKNVKVSRVVRDKKASLYDLARTVKTSIRAQQKVLTTLDTIRAQG